MNKTLIALVLICLSSPVVLQAKARREQLKPQPQELPWPQTNVHFPNNGILDISIGDQKAPVTIYEISSVTCFHCSQFHTEVYPKLKKEYIDTGKVRLILYHCPIDGPSFRAAMLLIKLPKEKRYGIIEKLWVAQPKWFPMDYSPKSMTKFTHDLSTMCGLSPSQIYKYIEDDGLAEMVIKDRYELDKVIKIDGTPTFVINGDVLMENPTYENVKKAIDQKLENKKKT